jgi:hypothetical protein
MDMNRAEMAAVNGVPAELLDAHGRLVITPNAVTLDGQRNVPADLRPGETLAAFLERHVPGIQSGAWRVSIGGATVPQRMWAKTYPKHGQVIACRASVGKQVIAIIAIAILTYFSMGMAVGLYGAMGGTFVMASAATTLAAMQAGIVIAGTMLINKVLGPKVPSMSGPAAARPIHSLSSQRNSARPYEPLPALWGEMRVTPDLASAPYTGFEGDDQYLSMILLGGINVHSAADLTIGDTPITNYSDVRVFYNGFSGMTSEDVPLYSNADSISGGELENDGPSIVRTSSINTVALQLDFEGQLYDMDHKGNALPNSVPLYIETRLVGTTTWLPALTTTLVNGTTDVMRRTFTIEVEQGQHEVSARLGKPIYDEGGGDDACKIGWNILRSIQPDETDYSAWGRIGIRIKATGQLSGALDTIRATYRARPIPLWNGSAWVTATTRENGLSNPGAILLQTLRGVYANGILQFGYGMEDEQIDIEGLKAFMLHCTAHGYTYDKWITGQVTLGQFCQEVALAGMGEFSWTDGSRPTAVFVASGQPLSGVVNMANMLKGSFEASYSLANAADGIEYQFLDRARNWETTTLRVAAPGVTTALNPARIQGEGVTTEAHAAVMARYHLAQSLYQYKTIGYSADMESLDYRRLSVLSISHDLTQWGYGGRLVAAELVGGKVQLTVGEDLPALATPHVGLRLPGERDYRVWAVEPAGLPGRVLTLQGTWPAGLPLPGATDDDPAHDTLWCFDFKATPGYRVRVVGMEAEPDLKGARVSCVPEGPEFWNYVINGEYEPAPNGSSLEFALPVVSNLRVTRNRVQVGAGWEHELSAVWDTAGNYDHAQVWAAPAGQPLVMVDASVPGSRSAWRVPPDQTWSVEVRPFDALGRLGTRASIIYTDPSVTVGAVVGLAATVESSGVALRWATPEGVAAVDWSGTQIRMGAPGSTWETASPVFQGKTDRCQLGWLAAGTHVFYAAHSNTAGDWSLPVTTSLVIAPPVQPIVTGNAWQLQVELQWTHSQGTQPLRGYEVRVGNVYADAHVRTTVDALGYIYQTAAAGTYMHWVTAIDVAGNRSAPGYLQLTTTPTIEDAIAELSEGFDEAIQDILNANQNVSDLSDTIDDVTASINAQIAAINSQLADIGGAPEWDAVEIYAEGTLVKFDGGLYQSLQAANTNKNPGTSPTWWTKIGDYDSLGEAVSALAAQTASNTNRIEIAEGAITSQSDAQTALYNQVNHATNGLPGKASAAALTTLTNRVTATESTNSSQGSAITSLQNTIDNPTTGLGSKASASSVSALTNRVTSAEGLLESQSTAITQVTGSVTTANTNAAAAQVAAANAATLAGSKGKVIVQNAAPDAADRLAQNLWIDTTNNANTPKRWNGTAWVSATDKVATDAAAAAAAAQATANTKADASALSALTQTVSDHGGVLNAHAGSLNQLATTVTTAQQSAINAAVLTETNARSSAVASEAAARQSVVANITSASDNLVANPGYDPAGYRDLVPTGSYTVDYQDRASDPNLAGAPAARLMVFQKKVSTAEYASRTIHLSAAALDRVSANVGDTFDVSYSALSGPATAGTTYLWLYGADINGNPVGNSEVVAYDHSAPGTWQRLRGTVTLSGGAVFVAAALTFGPAAPLNHYVWICDMDIRKRSATNLALAASVTATSAALATLDGKVAASYTLNVTAGNKVAGYRVGTDGATSDFVVLADKFAWAYESLGQVKYGLVTGLINGVASFGFNGNMYLDGTFTARMIAADAIRAIHIESHTFETRHFKTETLAALSAEFSRSANLLSNSVLLSSKGWTTSDGVGGGVTFQHDDTLIGPGFRPSGGHTLTIFQPNDWHNGSTAYSMQWVSDAISGIEVGTRHEFFVYTGAHRCIVDAYLAYYSASGTQVGSFGTVQNNNSEQYGGPSIGDFKRVHGFGVVPAGAVQARLILRKFPTAPGQSTSAAMFTLPFVAVANPHQTVPSPYTPSGQGTKIGPEGIETTSLGAISPDLGLVVHGRLVSADSQMSIDMDNKSIVMSRLGRRVQLTTAGGLYMGADNGVGPRLNFDMATGQLALNATFTADAINAVNTLNIAGEAVTATRSAAWVPTEWWRKGAVLASIGFSNIPLGSSGVLLRGLATAKVTTGSEFAGRIDVYLIRNNDGKLVGHGFAESNAIGGGASSLWLPVAVDGFDAAPLQGYNEYSIRVGAATPASLDTQGGLLAASISGTGGKR